jgi:hypothetical protein
MTTNYEKQEPGGLYRSVTDVWTSECSTSSVILQKGSLVTLLRVTPGDYFANVQFLLMTPYGHRKFFSVMAGMEPAVCLNPEYVLSVGTRDFLAHFEKVRDNS